MSKGILRIRFISGSGASHGLVGSCLIVEIPAVVLVPNAHRIGDRCVVGCPGRQVRRDLPQPRGLAVAKVIGKPLQNRRQMKPAASSVKLEITRLSENHQAERRS